MKKFFVLIAIVMLSVASYAQTSNEDFGTFEKVVQVELPKATLWRNLKTWVSTSFRSYKHTVDVEDQETGTLILKFSSSQICTRGVDETISATLKIDVRDNKFRYKIFDVKFGLTPNRTADPTTIRFLPTEEIKSIRNTLEASEEVLREGTKIDNSFKERVEEAKETSENTPQYKSAKDEKKGRISDDYQIAKAKYDILLSVKVNYYMLRDKISESLENALNTKDDF